MPSNSTLHTAGFILLALGASCSSATRAPSVPESSQASTVAGQVAHGAEVYSAQCASCHGDAGQGSLGAPPVAGAGALPLVGADGSQRTAVFHSAADIAGWVQSTMPPAAPGSLPDADYWAVLAFALQANSVTLNSPVDPTTAASIVLHE